MMILTHLLLPPLHNTYNLGAQFIHSFIHLFVFSSLESHKNKTLQEVLINI